jgi:hypothetical protein
MKRIAPAIHQLVLQKRKTQASPTAHRHLFLVQDVADLVAPHTQQHHVMAQVAFHGGREVLPVAVRHDGVTQVLTLVTAHDTPAGCNMSLMCYNKAYDMCRRYYR